MTRHTPSVPLALMLCALATNGAQAQTESPDQDKLQDQPASSAAEPAPKVSAPAGILPIPDYTGDLWKRRALLGDFDGGRTRLAEKGIQFDIVWNNTVQSVVSGGRDTTTAYGGTLDYNVTLDLMRMGILPGALIRMRGESRYGSSVNGEAGPLLPVNTDFLFPLTDELDEDIAFTLTTLSYTQFLSESFGLFLGKFDTLDGDQNEFASGRGLTQFQNSNLNFNSAMLIPVPPYSTLGGGIIWKPTPNVTLTSSVFTSTDSSTTTGFDTLDEGWSWASELQVQYRLGHLPGGFNIGGAYAFDNDFATINRRFIFTPGGGITVAPDQDSTWAAYASAWQYLVAEEPAENADAPLDLLNGKPDRKGFGLFVRLGFGDDQTNPVKLAFSGGLGGRGGIPGRDDDIWGIGYYLNDAQTDRVPSVIGARDEYQGFEAFYNIALTPAMELTLDAQVVQPPTDNLDTAVVLGARFLLRF